MTNKDFLKTYKKIFKRYHHRKSRYYYINGGRLSGKTYFQEMEKETNDKQTL